MIRLRCKYQADHKEVRTSTAKRWKSLDFQRFPFYTTWHNTMVHSLRAFNNDIVLDKIQLILSNTVF